MFRSISSKAMVVLAVVAFGVLIADYVTHAQEGRQRPQQPKSSSGTRTGAARAQDDAVPPQQARGDGGGTATTNVYSGSGTSGFVNPSTALSEAQHQSIENHDYAIQSYYQNKDVHDQYETEQRKLHPPLTDEQVASNNKRMEPGRLSSTQFDRSTNVIQWPALLRDEQFNVSRGQLDHLFHNRTPDTSGVDSDNYVQIKQSCEAMQAVLHTMIKELPANTYMVALHFIRSLEYEGQFTAM